MKKPVDFADYISLHPKEVQSRFWKIRATIRKLAPDSEELISYGIPAFTYHGPLVYFAGYSNHIGLYPAPSGITGFSKELSIYKRGKGSVQFPHDQPLPIALITKIVKFRVAENLAKSKKKKK